MTNKKNVYILFLICFLQGLVFYYPISTLYRTSHGLTLVEISMIESVSFIVTLLFEIPWGYLGDRWGLKRVLIVANGLYFISKYIFYIADGFTLFLIERIILGLAIAGLSGCDSSLLYLSSGDNHIKTFSIYSLCGTLGLMVASVVYSILLVDNYSLAAFLCMIMYMISFVLTFMLDDLKEESRDNERTSINISTIIKGNKTVLMFIIGSVLFSETIRELTLFIGQVRLLEVNLSSSLFGVVAFLLTVMEFSSIFSDRLSNWLGYFKLIIIGVMVSACSMMFIGYFDNSYTAVIGLLILSMNGALLNPIFEVIQQESIEGVNRVSTISMYNVFGSCVGIALNVMYGWLGDYSSKLVYYVAIVVIAVSVLGMGIYIKKVDKK